LGQNPSVCNDVARRHVVVPAMLKAFTAAPPGPAADHDPAAAAGHHACCSCRRSNCRRTSASCSKPTSCSRPSRNPTPPPRFEMPWARAPTTADPRCGDEAPMAGRRLRRRFRFAGPDSAAARAKSRSIEDGWNEALGRHVRRRPYNADDDDRQQDYPGRAADETLHAAPAVAARTRRSLSPSATAPSAAAIVDAINDDGYLTDSLRPTIAATLQARRSRPATRRSRARCCRWCRRSIRSALARAP
jgi:hypothetical protein